jgi:hypothetical protein
MHVISSIVHEYYDEKVPWPIEIEDHDGQLHSSLVLQEGCSTTRAHPEVITEYRLLPVWLCMCVCSVLRRQILKGKYYASIFIHYMPADKSIWDFTFR